MGEAKGEAYMYEVEMEGYDLINVAKSQTAFVVGQ